MITVMKKKKKKSEKVKKYCPMMFRRQPFLLQGWIYRKGIRGSPSSLYSASFLSGTPHSKK